MKYLTLSCSYSSTLTASLPSAANHAVCLTRRYYLFGWAFAYGDKLDDTGNSIGNPFIGTDQFAMAATDGTKYNTFLFQYVVRPDCSSSPGDSQAQACCCRHQGRC